MTTNLKIHSEDGVKSRVKLASAAGSDSTLTIHLVYNPTAWNNGTGSGVNGLISLEKVGGKGFPVDNNPDNNKFSKDVDYIKITGPTPQLTILQRLIYLKDDVRNTKPNCQNAFDFELVINKDLANQSDRWTITGGDTIELTAADFGGVLDESKLIIDDTVFHTKANNKIETVVSRSDQKQTLLDLEKLLYTTLPAKYGSLELKGSDTDLPDPTATPPLIATGLFTFYHGPHPENSAKPDIAKDPENIKHILKDLKDDKNDKIYDSELVDWVGYLYLIKITKELGITKKYQILTAFNDKGGGGVIT